MNTLHCGELETHTKCYEIVKFENYLYVNYSKLKCNSNIQYILSNS